jgi:hypothetical protein
MVSQVAEWQFRSCSVERGKHRCGMAVVESQVQVSLCLESSGKAVMASQAAESSVELRRVKAVVELQGWSRFVKARSGSYGKSG